MVKYTVPGAPIPTKIRELWKEYQSQGYGVCIDFPPLQGCPALEC
ncbi:hypothetical protein Z046_33040 [Pseudomonas aeruginosa VRFPA09]|nr:hypothetical protein Z046_33040 [Pseudomonas aeruginosa VRFPA09]